jgi:hypothetical protein
MNRVLIYCISLMVLAVIAISCTHPKVSEAELKAFVLNPENGLVKESLNNNLKGVCYLRPNDLIIAQKAYGLSFTMNQLDSMRLSHQHLLFFTLQLSKDGREIETYFASNPEAYNDVLHYLSSEMRTDLRLTTKYDTLSPVEFLYSPGFGAAQATSLMVVFELKEKPDNDLSMHWYDSYFKSGQHTYTYLLSDFNNIPELNLNQL